MDADETVKRVRQMRSIVESLSAQEPYWPTPNGMECTLCGALVDEGEDDEYSQHWEYCSYRQANEFMGTPTVVRDATV